MNRADILAKRLLENEPDATPKPAAPDMQTSSDVKNQINQLLPTKTYRFKGNSFWNAAGMLNLAVRPFLVGTGKKEQKWGLGVMRAMNAPEPVIDALINNRATIEPDGDDAIVTVKLYDENPAKRKRKVPPPPA